MPLPMGSAQTDAARPRLNARANNNNNFPDFIKLSISFILGEDYEYGTPDFIN